MEIPHKPKVIVLILSYNGKYLLYDSVNSYVKNDYENFKVVVIDNGSTDGTSEYLHEDFKTVKVLRLELNQGYSGGFNFGLDYSFKEENADYVLISNNDVLADQKVISSLVEVAEKDNKNGFTTGKVYFYDNPSILQTVGKIEHPILWNGQHRGANEPDRGQFDQECELPFADDIFTLVKNTVYFTTGGYDTTFFLQSEEYDWQARAKSAGFKIMYTPNAKIWHKDSMTIGKSSAIKEYYNARNQTIVILKHRTAAQFKRYFWYHLWTRIIRRSVKLAFFEFNPMQAVQVWKGFFSSLKWGIKERKLSFRHIF
jgi:GT2 family glycosyltransferase